MSHSFFWFGIFPKELIEARKVDPANKSNDNNDDAQSKVNFSNF